MRTQALIRFMNVIDLLKHEYIEYYFKVRLTDDEELIEAVKYAKKAGLKVIVQGQTIAVKS